jgi:type I restriction enzyme S subunit
MSETNGGRIELPEGWEWRPLTEVAATSSGGTPSRSRPEFYEGDIPWLKIGDLNDGVVSEASEFISQVALDSSSAKVLGKGTLLIAMYGSIGKLGILGMEAATNQAICAVVPDDEFLSRDFLFWWFVFQRPQLLAAGYGGTQANISQGYLKKLLLPLPPRKEQDRIVDQVEARVGPLKVATELLGESLDKSNALRRSILDEAVTGSWDRIPLMDLLVSLRNGIYVSRPAADLPGIPILRISAVRPMALDLSDIRYAPGDIEPDEKFFVGEGDLLFTRYSGNPNYVGACAVVKDLQTQTLYPDKLIRAVVDRSKVEPAFLQIACSAGQTLREIIERRKTTAGQVGIAGGQLKTVSVPIPPLNTQREIWASVEASFLALDRLRAEIGGSLKSVGQLRQAVLHKAFAGQNRETQSAAEISAVM